MEEIEYRIKDTVYYEKRRVLCRGETCGHEIAWAKSEDGKYHPFDPETGDSHFSTCPDRADFLRK